MKTLLFMWDHIGPMHDDRLQALSRHFRGRYEIAGLEITSRSDTYDWESPPAHAYRKITLFPSGTRDKIRFHNRLYRLLKTCLASQNACFFFSSYQYPEIFLTACLLRLSGRKVFSINNSKFDDYPRFLCRELGKRLFFLPYAGAISGSLRSTAYLRFLTSRKHPIVQGANTLSIARIQALAATGAPGTVPFADRHFSIIARLVPKKNIATGLEAYALYRREAEAGGRRPRKLHIYGNGPLEPELRAAAKDLGVETLVVFHGFIQSDQIAPALSRTLALILPSTEEQFGNVIIEAQAVSVPVIVSDNCGACDELVRSGVNGFIINPRDPQDIAFFMNFLDTDQDAWEKMSSEARHFWPLMDTPRFAQAVEMLLEQTRAA